MMWRADVYGRLMRLAYLDRTSSWWCHRRECRGLTLYERYETTTTTSSTLSWCVLEMCGNGFFVPNPESLPFQWLQSHSHSIPIRNLNPVPIFAHRAIPNSLQFPFPFGNLRRHLCIYEEFFFLRAADACADSRPTVLNKLKKASELTIKWLTAYKRIKCQLERTTTKQYC